MSPSTNRPEGRTGSLWRHPLTVLGAAGLLFLTVSGFAITYLPGHRLNQMNVLIHTVVGLLLTIPLVVYVVKHWVDYRKYGLNHFKVTGYIAAAVLAICLYTGFTLTWDGLFGTRISYADRTIHLVSTWALFAFMVPHVVWLLVRDRKGSKLAVRAATQTYVVRTTVGVLVFAVVLAGAWVLRPQVQFQTDFPEDYSFVYAQGDDPRPFSPSMARTPDDGPIDQRLLSGSKGCGSEGCHTEIYREWAVSAHRWSAMDVGFQSIQSTMAAQNGYESTRYCGGCHDPISLFSGTKNTDPEHLTDAIGYDEGISCLACHGIRTTDLQGNANYVIDGPDRYLFELQDGAGGQDRVRLSHSDVSATARRLAFETPLQEAGILRCLSQAVHRRGTEQRRESAASEPV